ncbi:MAG: helix-turn-helix transcriptional regulator [Pyramidobacter sp.]|nr:helix-turn-helix transcriptional regulator [Pyramidobacter sp.]
MIGDLIKKYRKERGLTQAELSEALHIVQTHVSRIEGGPALPSLELLVGLVNKLEIPGTELLEELNILPQPPREEKMDSLFKRLFELTPELSPEQKRRVREFLTDQIELARLRSRGEKQQ